MQDGNKPSFSAACVSIRVFVCVPFGVLYAHAHAHIPIKCVGNDSACVCACVDTYTNEFMLKTKSYQGHNACIHADTRRVYSVHTCMGVVMTSNVDKLIKKK